MKKDKKKEKNLKDNNEDDKQKSISKSFRISLIKLEINNFKSFKGIHEIGYFKDYTAIVGATGSGKSNITDAISFACGNSSKLLRSETLKCLVNTNSYSSNKKYSSYVKLFFKTQEDQDEYKFDLIIERRVTTNGSEFYINSEKMTQENYFKNLEEYGIQKFAKFFIIGQNYVDSFIENNFKNGSNKNQLTHCLEELSGSIQLKSKYEKYYNEVEEKTESISNLQKKINVVKAKIKELNNANSTEDQLEEINQELNKILNEIFLYKLLEQDNEISQNEQQLKDFNDNTDKIKYRKDELVKELKELKIRLTKQEDQDTQNNKTTKLHLKQVTDELSEKISEIKRNKEMISNLESQIMTKLSQQQANEKEINQNNIKEKNLKQELTRLQEASDKIDKNLSIVLGCDLNENEKSEFLRLNKEFENKAKIELGKKNNFSSNLINKEHDIVEQEKLLNKLEEEISKINFSSNELNRENKILEESFINIDVEINDQTKKLNEILIKLDVLINEVQGNDEISKEKSNIIDRYQQQFGLTNKRKKVKELYLPGIIGFMNELVMPANPKYELALKVAMAKYSSFLVVKDKDTAEICLKYFEENDISQDMLILEKMEDNSFNKEDLQINTNKAKKMSSLVKTKKNEINKIVNYFLGELYFCESRDYIKEIQKLGCKRLILQDGTVVKKGVFKGGSYKNLMALNIEEIDISKELNLLRELEALVENGKDQIKNLEKNKKETEEKLNKLTITKKLDKEKQIQIKNNIASNNLKFEKLIINKKSIEELLSNFKSQKTKIEIELSSVNDGLQKIKESFYKSFFSKKSSQDEKMSNLIFSMGEIEVLQKELKLLKEKKNLCLDELDKITDKVKLKDELKEIIENAIKQKQKLIKDNEIFEKQVKSLSEKKDKLNEELEIKINSNETLRKEEEKLSKELDLQEKRLNALIKNKKEYEHSILNGLINKKKIVEEFKLNISSYMSKFKYIVTDNFKVNVNQYIIKEQKFVINKDYYDKNSATVLKIEKESNCEIDYKNGEVKIKVSANPKEKINKLEKDFSELLAENDEINQLKLLSTNDTNALKQKIQKLEDEKSKLDEEIKEEVKILEQMEKSLSDFKKERKKLFVSYIEKVNLLLNNMYCSFYEVNPENFNQLANLETSNKDEPFNGITLFNVHPPNKEKNLGIKFLSGGEKTIALASLILTLQKISMIPFVIFDEIDAYLDKKHEELLENKFIEHSSEFQLIIVTHKTSLSRSSSSLIGSHYNKKNETSVAISVDMTKLSN